MVLSKKTNTNLLIIIGLTLSLTFFIIDLLTPLGIADGFFYIAVILLSIRTNEKKATIAVAITSIVLIIAGYFLSPPTPPIAETYIAITNRLLSIIVIIVCAFVIIKYKRIEQIIIKQHVELQQLTINLKTINSELEDRVKERTVVLEGALRKLEKSEAELQKSLEHEKEINELKTRFVSMASHEFRTPLTTILSSLSLVSDYGKLNQKEKQSKHIYRIKNAVSHLTDLINDVLSVSKLEEGKINIFPEKIQINNLVLDIIEKMKLIAKLNQKIEYKHNGKDEIMMDKKILKHILLNLVSNAIKFSDEGGIVNVITEMKDSVFTLRVEDFGIGIPAEDQKHLFERFFRGNNVSAIQGTGLGLEIVAKYVELMKGKITFTSGLGEGTTFIVHFNLSEDTSQPQVHLSKYF